MAMLNKQMVHSFSWISHENHLLLANHQTLANCAIKKWDTAGHELLRGLITNNILVNHSSSEIGAPIIVYERLDGSGYTNGGVVAQKSRNRGLTRVSLIRLPRSQQLT